MSRIPPLDFKELDANQLAALKAAEEKMGFIANDALVMARDPAMMQAFSDLVGAVYKPGLIDDGFKRLIGLITSAGAGCQYCMAHTAHTSKLYGIEAKRREAVWQFEESPLFNDKERVALRVAFAAGQTPNEVDDAMYATLSAQFTIAEQLEIVAVISLFGFLNRWNSTLATTVEAVPAASLDELPALPVRG
ncbi:MAG: carboxymuconolactone decarboxylase family protein [Woeseiaceae bacterium]